MSPSDTTPLPATTVKSKATGRRRTKIKDLIAQYQHDETLCRYKNKLCLNPRARKRRGGLHTFCEVHREAANRNQRRLDQRKRIQKRQREAGAMETMSAPSSPVSPCAILDLDILSPLSDTSSVDLDLLEAPSLVPEPSETPVPLKDEDLDTLQWLFDVDDIAVRLHSMDADLPLEATMKIDPTRLQWA